MTTTTARPIAFAIDGIEVCRGRLWNNILIDVAARWSRDPKIVAAVTSNIEWAIRRGHSAICYTDDAGERVAVSWEIEQ